MSRRDSSLWPVEHAFAQNDNDEKKSFEAGSANHYGKLDYRAASPSAWHWGVRAHSREAAARPCALRAKASTPMCPMPHSLL
ncbi:MAG: hypothetical protein G01um1014106_166 [Parcubacteria group bacterium Gr01-1014_106]|nr:MAG: hypothetical protein G01um1014106_166 [Parcubacteria group bacterium Gr01-1014_106]